MEKILVTGGNGQLGNCLKKLEEQYSDYEFLFTSSSELDITNEDSVKKIFEDFQPQYCINASAYTAVDLAETEKEKAYAVNAYGVENLAKASAENNAVFIHVSTDYVFDGVTNLAYTEDDFTDPIGVYGNSKREGEILALEANPNTIILRTSWLYSEFNKNFVKTMLHLFSTKDELGIVADQYGQPTNAADLAEAIMTIISTPKKIFGIYHFSNYGETTWYDFASKIAELSGSSIKLKPLTTAEYPTPAKRPERSTMCLDKIEQDYKIIPEYWENSLEECINILQK
ncbi:dTDP-4-dehydrorhamnose reductase [Elizabethkingia miricola]|uniref:dTDP-4-dehydrorhamnose reductase n=1 Tax=Elizabethkingia miricola TaxID=172045 RepID=UPI000B35C94B|nr:dTDP-4-dehydrorhamnose reductase [Elizabethkingia miricola]NHQ65358.1 dTDP-4-dehydrorhamnose reductase [Elizabethkingia miricola]NHQ69436.1 dTDP-4-dehydrorhamnose reductase [Elizabethkingia miricola]NHQ77270.1 dTDP-4-dehydrorhamnose reductase [Elizabethkingia miricola]PSL87496.1 dTDP-4-dehydrorhamnose reductase [Elizabethkingia miricola]QHQ87223.1 dTDP-4-dehydrorhamnose reductase [Elizabethkingia miricola]